MPEANRFLLYVIAAAAVAEHEAQAISDRTKATAAMARGVKLGWSIPERASEQRQAAKKGVAVNKARALITQSSGKTAPADVEKGSHWNLTKPHI